MKKLISILGIISFFFQAHSQNLEWANSIKINYTDYINDIHVDRDGSLIICGQFSSMVDFDPGPDSAFMSPSGGFGADIFIAKYDSNGVYLWSHRFGSNFFYDDGSRITTDAAGNIYVTGFFGSTADFDPDSAGVFTLTASGSNRGRFLAKYDTNGNFINAKKAGNAVGSLPSSQDAQTGLACDLAGNVYMSGFYGTSLTLGPGINGTLAVSGLSDNYFAKYDSTLNLIWAHRLGSAGTEYSQGMYVDDTGLVIVLGSFANTIDLDPDTTDFLLNHLGSTEDGYFAEYDSAGHFIFAKHLVPGTSCAPIAVTIDSRKNIILTGSCSGTLDADPDSAAVASIGSGFNDQVFLASYDSVGNYHWAFAYGDISAYQAGTSVSLDSADNIYLTGFYQPFVDLDPDTSLLATLGSLYSGFVAIYDTAGNFKTAFNGTDALLHLKIHDDAIYMTGFYYGLVDFDPGPSVYTMMSDTPNASWYLLKLHLCDSLAAMPGVIDIPSVCGGDTITVHVNQGGPQYEWTFTSGLFPVGNLNNDSIRLVVDTSSMNEIITCRSIGGCMNSAVAYSHIFVNHPTIPLINQAGDSLFTTSDAIAWQWYRNDTIVNGANDSLFVPTISGMYSVSITDSNGCSAVSPSYSFVFTGTKNVDVASVNIYPNPFSSIFTLEVSSNVKEGIVILKDVNGREVMKNKFNGNKITLNAETISPGVYFIEWNTGTSTNHSRLVKF